MVAKSFLRLSVYSIGVLVLVLTVFFLVLFHLLFPQSGGAFIGAMVGFFCYVLGINFFIMFHPVKAVEYWLQWLFFLVFGAVVLLAARSVSGHSIRAFPEFIEILKLIVSAHLFINIIAFGVKYVLHLLDNEEW